MNHRSLLTDVYYRGLVHAAKRSYHVYEARDSSSCCRRELAAPADYYLVERKALNYLLGRVGGSRSIATSEVLDACRRSKFLKRRFSVLNTLYALVAIKKARIIGMQGQSLLFAVSKGAV